MIAFWATIFGLTFAAIGAWFLVLIGALITDDKLDPHVTKTTPIVVLDEPPAIPDHMANAGPDPSDPWRLPFIDESCTIRKIAYEAPPAPPRPTGPPTVRGRYAYHGKRHIRIGATMAWETTDELRRVNAGRKRPGLTRTERKGHEVKA